MPDPAPATAPAATPAPAAKAPGPVAPASTFDARLALAKSLGKPGDGKPAPPPAPTKGENVDAPATTPAPEADPSETDAESSDETAAEPEIEAESGDGEASETPDTAEDKVTGALAALAKGDLSALVTALGGDAKAIPLPTKHAFVAMAKRESKAKARDAAHDKSVKKAHGELATESNRLSALQRHIANEYGFAKQGRDAWEAEEFHVVGKALEKWLKTDLATITQKLASGKAGKTPEEKTVAQERAALARERAEFEAAKRAEEGTKTAAQKREAAVTRVGTALATHPFLTGTDGKQDPEALDEVFAAYEKTWDGSKFGKTAKQCADELQAKLESRAAKRGMVKAAPGTGTKPGTGKTPPGKVPPKAAARPRIAEPPRTVPNKNLGTPADMEATRALRIANAKRISEQFRRGMGG